MGLVIEDRRRPAPGDDPGDEVLDLLDSPCGRPRPQDGRHHVRLLVVGLRALVELVDVRQVQRAQGSAPLAFPTHVTLEVPEDPQVVGDDRVDMEDAASLEVRPEPFEHDDVRGEHQERPGEVVAGLGQGVEVLPGDRQGHDLGLAAARGHLDAITREFIVLEQREILPGRERLDQLLLAPDPGHLVEVDQGFHGMLLEIVILEPASVGEAVVGMEPPVQQAMCRVARARVTAPTPGIHLVADRRHAGSRIQLDVEQRCGRRVFLLGGRLRLLLAAHDRCLSRSRCISSRVSTETAVLSVAGLCEAGASLAGSQTPPTAETTGKMRVNR